MALFVDDFEGPPGPLAGRPVGSGFVWDEGFGDLELDGYGAVIASTNGLAYSSVFVPAIDSYEFEADVGFDAETVGEVSVSLQGPDYWTTRLNFYLKLADAGATIGVSFFGLPEYSTARNGATSARVRVGVSEGIVTAWLNGAQIRSEPYLGMLPARDAGWYFQASIDTSDHPRSPRILGIGASTELEVERPPQFWTNLRRTYEIR